MIQSEIKQKISFFPLLIYDNRHFDPPTTRPHPSDPELKLVGLKLNKLWSHLCCCWPFLFPSFLPAPAVKSLFYPSCREAAKTRGNGVYRGGTEELVHICTVLVTTLTLQQSLRESKMVPVGRPARRRWHVLLRLSHIWACSSRYLLFACRAALPEPQRGGNGLRTEYSSVHPLLGPELTHQRLLSHCSALLVFFTRVAHVFTL